MNDLPSESDQILHESSPSINEFPKDLSQPLLTSDSQPNKPPLLESPNELLSQHRQLDIPDEEPILQEIQYTKEEISLPQKNALIKNPKENKRLYADSKGSGIMATALTNRWYDVYEVWIAVLLVMTIGSVIPLVYYLVSSHVAVLVFGIIGAGILAVGLVFELIAIKEKSLKKARRAVWWMIGFMVYFTVTVVGMMFFESSEHKYFVSGLFVFILFFISFVLCGAVRVRNELDKIYEALDSKYSNFGRA